MLARVVIGSASVSLFGGIFVMVSASNLFSSNVEIGKLCMDEVYQTLHIALEKGFVSTATQQTLI